ncbi:MAG: carbohydrate deacetylase [Anaerolineae bacterium]|nr:carbohydrate deacetylase [Anaerolineae bacterium]
MKRLIVNADDFGRTPGIDAGILRAHRQGIVTSTTAMVNLPGAAAGVRWVRVETPALGIGVHLNLTAGRPLLPAADVPTLVDETGHFYPIRALTPRLDDLDRAQVEAELTAQIERLRAWGTTPTHLDAHHHLLYLTPDLFRILLVLAERYALPIRYPWPCGALPAQDLSALAEAHRVAPDALPQVIAACNALLEGSQVRAPERCVLTFYGAGATLGHLLDVIAGLPEGISEVMCHPGFVDAALQASSGYGEGRERELAILTDPALKEALREAGVQLVDFSAL